MSLENRMEALEKELASLRRRNRAMSVFALLALSVPVLLGFGNAQEKVTTPTIPMVIKAERFEVWKDGKQMAILRSDQFSGRLSIYNKDGKSVARLSSYQNGGILEINNNHGTKVAGLIAHPDGGYLGIQNNALITVASLAADPNGGWLKLYTPRSIVRFAAPP